METIYPSIFNDVIGPIMRGPSSSHCAASLRIGRLARDLMDGMIEAVRIEFDPKGSLSTTHDSQGADMGLFAGFLGWNALDERLKDSPRAIKEAGVKVDIRIAEYGAVHPNTYKINLKNKHEAHEIIAISTGGGMIEIVEIDGVSVSIKGDFFETLVYVDTNEENILSYIEKSAPADTIRLCKGDRTAFIEVKAQDFLDRQICTQLKSKKAVRSIKKLFPVLPIMSRKEITVPFITCQEMMKYNSGRNLELWKMAAHYESIRGNIPPEQVFEKMKEIVGHMRKSIQLGLSGTEYPDRILGFQSGFFKTQMENNRLLDGGIFNQIILSVTAVMEVKSAMGIIVAAPTAGSCGVLPGVCIGTGNVLGLSEDEITKGLLAAGMIGVFIAAQSTFAAEVGGCQAECGAASGMAAAALVNLAKGNSQQAIDAASMALQNILGMVCDPVANRVEVPCLGKNVLAAGNALASANMALANFDSVIPLDEVIATMDTVGRSLPSELRCTALGGLSTTNASRKLEKRLKNENRHLT
jgi:L-serine dehydratase